MCVMGSVGGSATKPGMAERTWVMPKAERTAGDSAVDRSEMYNLGIISVMEYPGGRCWEGECETAGGGGCGCGDDHGCIMVWGGGGK